MQDNTTIENINIDEFLPMPGADDIVTSDSSSKGSMFSRSGADADVSFLDNPPKKEEAKDDAAAGDQAKGAGSPDPAADAAKVFEELDADLDPDTDKDTAKPKSRSEKGMVETFSKLFEEGLLVPFEDDKPLEEYSVKDWKELIQANLESKIEEVKSETPKEFFEALPEELQYAAKYVADGGTDLKGLFRVLAESQQTKELNVADPDDQETIVRKYLQATQFGSPEDIDEQIELYRENGKLGAWAQKHKPKLDNMQEQVIKRQLEQQEAFKELQIEQRKKFVNNVYEALAPGEINGMKIDKKTQEYLWEEITQTKYQSLSGRPTNKLGHLLETYQFGEKPRYDLILEATMLLDNPEAYKERIRNEAVNKNTQETVRKLKTEEARKTASTTIEEPEEKTAARSKKLSRPSKNIFARS